MKELKKPDHLGHRQRIKEKYKKSGMAGWLDYEVLELAISYAIARKEGVTAKDCDTISSAFVYAGFRSPLA